MSHHGAEYHNQSGRDSDPRGRDSDPRGRDSDPRGSHSHERHRSGSSGRNATKHVNGRNQDHHDHRGQEYQGQRGQEYHGQRGQGNHGQRGQEYPGQKEQERFAPHDQKGQNYPAQYRGNQRGGNWNRGQPQSYRGNPNREYGRGRGSYNNDQQYDNSYSQGAQHPYPAGQQSYYGPSGGQQYVQPAQGHYSQGDRGQYNQRRQQTEGYGFRQQRSRVGSPVQRHTRKEGRKEGRVYLTTHSTHFIYGYMASDIWLRTILIVRKETRCHHIGYSFR